MTDKQKGKLGIIGGMGPMATSVFYEGIINHTEAHTDQDHLNMVILSCSDIPDRTAAILSGDSDRLLSELRHCAEDLERLNCTAIAIPCNTSHYYYDRIAEFTEVPVINMIRETALATKAMFPNAEKVGIMATDGTVNSGVYEQALREVGLTPVRPGKEAQKLIMSLIYDDIKAGKAGDSGKFDVALTDLIAQGCNAVILACTELSVYKEQQHVPGICIDALDVLVRVSIERTGGIYK